MKKPSTTVVIATQTVLIAVLITGILAFVGGMKYQANTNNQVHAQAKAMASVSKR